MTKTYEIRSLAGAIKQLERCRRPIAVFPRRLKERIVFQTGVALHGGKVYVSEMRMHYAEDDRMPFRRWNRSISRTNANSIA